MTDGGMTHELRRRLWHVKKNLLSAREERERRARARRARKAATGAAPEDLRKDTIEWGEAKAANLWFDFYEPYRPVIDHATVLDLGCSWGYFLMYLGENFRPARLIGVDTSPVVHSAPEEWDRSRLEDRLQLFEGDLTELSELEERSIDLITCSSVMQYMTPELLEQTLERAYDLLRPGGQMILRTRVFTSHIGADLHHDFTEPYVHLLWGEPELAGLVEEHQEQPPRYLNPLTASTYLAIFHRVGFEVVEADRRMNSVAPEVMQVVRERFPWIAEEELLCAELDARLLRPFELEDLGELGEITDTRPKSGLAAYGVGDAD